jgi:hypothetical protein
MADVIAAEAAMRAKRDAGIDLSEKVVLFKRFGDAYYLSVRQGLSVRHPPCMGCDVPDWRRVQQLDRTSNQTYNLAPCEWTPFHWSSYERHKTGGPFADVSVKGRSGMAFQFATSRERVERSRIELPARSRELGFNDDERGRDVE